MQALPKVQRCQANVRERAKYILEEIKTDEAAVVRKFRRTAIETVTVKFTTAVDKRNCNLWGGRDENFR